MEPSSHWCSHWFSSQQPGELTRVLTHMAGLKFCCWNCLLAGGPMLQIQKRITQVLLPARPSMVCPSMVSASVCLSVCLSGSGSMLATVSRNVCLHGVCVSTVICICVAPFFKTGRLHALLHSGHSWQALTLQAAHLHQHVSSAWPRARSEPSLAFRTWDGHAVGGTDTRPAA